MIYRIDITSKDGQDGQAIQATAAEAGVQATSVQAARVFFVDSPDPASKVTAIAIPLLADPVVEIGQVITQPAAPGTGHGTLEIHLKPGVMDPVAASTELALRQAGLTVSAVRTGRSFRFSPPPTPEALTYLGSRVLGNAVIEAVHLTPWLPASFPTPRLADFTLRHVPIRTLSNEALQNLSKTGHLFLNLAEMQQIQSHFQSLNRDPTDVELETLAQTWSEHCVHKTLKAKTEVFNEQGQLLRTYNNLIKDTIFQSTQTLIAERKAAALSSPSLPHSLTPSLPASQDFCLSVFKDNAGVIAFDDTHAVCFKVETHNRPSAIDPYGGAATGVGGCIRDVIGTGLGAKPIANTDVFCVAFPDNWEQRGTEASRHEGTKGNPENADSSLATRNSQLATPLPPGVLHPKRVLTQVVAGVRDYGNRMGIPTINGAVFFDDRYVANPLVFCGCIGLLPRNRINKAAQPGDAIVVIGGRTGRDGIHGATFSSAELTSTHADEFSHAVQIGNAITQKKMMDVVLKAADQSLFTAITDCGAGGLSSAVGEMGEKLGATVHLDKVPLKYAGLRYDEIWISEAQERVVVSVPPSSVEALLALAKSEDVEATVIGTFGTENAHLTLLYNTTQVAHLSMHFLHNGVPMPTRKAVVQESRSVPLNKGDTPAFGWWSALLTNNEQLTTNNSSDPLATRNSQLATLSSLLAHPNIASKHFIVRQYDHEVQGMSVVKPFAGRRERGPSDASVLRPKPSSHRGVAVGCGMSPWTADPYEMALLAIDEAVRNTTAVGGDPAQTAILDNFCWPGTDNEHAMGDLVRTAEACRDAALAYKIPFISGKDSLHNQYTNKTTGQVTRIPNTLLISAIAIVPDIRRCITMDLKKPNTTLYLLHPSATDLAARIATHHYLASLIAENKILSAHDISDGGWLTALAEMAIASPLGAKVTTPPTTPHPFQELTAAYLIESPTPLTPPPGLHLHPLAQTTPTPTFTLSNESIEVEKLAAAWMGTLDW